MAARWSAQACAFDTDCERALRLRMPEWLRSALSWSSVFAWLSVRHEVSSARATTSANPARRAPRRRPAGASDVVELLVSTAAMQGYRPDRTCTLSLNRSGAPDFAARRHWSAAGGQLAAECGTM